MPRPLYGPIVSELAGDIEGIHRDQFLLDAGKMAKLLAELQGGAGLDVVWVATATRGVPSAPAYGAPMAVPVRSGELSTRVPGATSLPACTSFHPRGSSGCRRKVVCGRSKAWYARRA